MPQKFEVGGQAENRVRFQRPSLPNLDEVGAFWAPAREAHWYSNTGPVLMQFANALECYLGGGIHAVPVNNATSGLMIALRALCKPGSGSTVVMPSYTFAATATAALWAGFEPRFVDVDTKHWHADPQDVERAVEQEKPAALLLCSTYGISPPQSVVDQWTAVATRASIPLIVDSAAGFGSRDENGAFSLYGDAQIFSFHATKPFAIGEGGLVTTRDPSVARTLRRLANFGFDDDRVVRQSVGMNAKMDELHAAVGLAALQGFDDVLSRRRQYVSAIAGAFAAAGLLPQAGMSGAAHQFLPMMCRDSEQRDHLVQVARDQGIELRTYFSEPLHLMPAFAAYRDARSPLHVTRSLASRVACFPVYSHMSDDILERLFDLATQAGV